jgi:autonomous glycyl radical cofactor GrcA
VWYNDFMPKRSSKNRQPEDVNVLAASIVEEATSESGKNPHAVALGRLGGKKGGPARAKKLTPEQRREIAQRAARVRWGT